MRKPRTVRDFVADCLKRGRSPEQVRAIALSTHWDVAEVERELAVYDLSESGIKRQTKGEEQ